MAITNRVNSETIEGRIYQQNLALRKVENKNSKNFGKDFINGSIDIATSDDNMNVLTVHYTYVSPVTNNGAENRTFSALKRIMDEDKTVVTVGADNAMMVRCAPSIALNDFYPRGQEELVSQPRNEGGFVTILRELNSNEAERNKFTADALITAVIRKDDDEAGVNADLKGAIFNFRGNILPFTFKLRNEEAISYFESLDPSSSEPVLTKVWGKIVSRLEIQTQETESAFGEPAVDTKQRRVREWVVTGAAKEPYVFGDGGIITPEDIVKATEDRNLMLAETKKRSDEYYAQHNGGASGTSTVSQIPQGGFNF